MATAPIDSQQLEQERIKLEREKLKVEWQKAKWAAVSSVIPIVVALGTIIYGVWSLRQTAESQFETKAAELALAAPDPDQAKNRARLLAKFFREALPPDFEARLQQVNPEDYGTGGDPYMEGKLELFKAIAAHPDKKEELVATWEALFPPDKWAAALHKPAK